MINVLLATPCQDFKIKDEDDESKIYLLFNISSFFK